MASGIPAQLNIASWFIDRPAQLHPERVAIAGDPQTVTYGELRNLVNRVGNILRGIGCAPGMRVLIALPDSVEFVAAFFGTAKIGAVAIAVNPFGRTDDFSHYLQDSTPDFAVVHSAALPQFLPAMGNTAPRVLIVGDNSASQDHISWKDAVLAASTELEAAATRAIDPAFFLYTSGSTGKPKGVVHRHRNMVATSRNFGQGVLAIRPDDRTFSISKSFFAYGLGNGMYYPFSVGADTVFDSEKTSLDRVANLMKRYKPTLFFAVPTFYRAVVDEAAKGLQFDFSSIRIMVCGGEPLSVKLFNEFYERFGIQLLQGLGTTEMLHTYISNRPLQIRPGSSGVPVPGFETRLIGEDEKPVPTGAIGTLHIRGESRFAGYWNGGKLSAEANGDEWLVTSDKFYCDADGYYHFCGRNDDMVKISGMSVLPIQVEAELQNHPQVNKAVVLGRQVGGEGSSLVAYVKPNGQATLDSKSLRHYLHGCLPEYMIPRYFVILNEFPLMANGKINRQALPLPAHEVPPAQASRYVAPGTPTEIELSNIWSSVLGIQSVGMEDDFVDLGGSSAAGMQCLSRIGKAFSVNLPLGSLLGENSTLRSVAATIDELRSTEVKTAQSSAAG